MPGYTKLFSSIVTSTIWCQDYPTRLVWVSMMAMSDAQGKVEGSIPGFARVANVTVDEMRHAIQVLSAPDPESRTPDNQGRRIESVPGGWRILNYMAYRESRDPDIRRQQNREAQAKFRAKAASRNHSKPSKPEISPSRGSTTGRKDSVFYVALGSEKVKDSPAQGIAAK